MPSNSKLAIEVWFLTGRYVATAYNDRHAHEWPPHFARLFSALVSAWAENGEDQSEKECLLWLELLGTPSIVASSCAVREAKSHWVPVNDHIVRNSKDPEELEKNLRGFFPENRAKQERYFPSCTPEHDRVVFVWDLTEEDQTYRDCLELILSRITRLGHSSSFAHCRLLNTGDELKPQWVPSEDGELSLRTVGRGALEGLVSDFKRHEGVRQRAFPFPHETYRRVCKTTTTVKDAQPERATWIIYEFDQASRFLPNTRAVEITKLFRRALFSYVSDPIPESISGHSPDGQPTKLDHVGVLAIPHVSSSFADGRLLGIVLAVPNTVSDSDKRKLHQGLWEWERLSENGNITLHLGRAGELKLSRIPQTSGLVGLREQTWTRKSRVWASATPVALPQHPGKLNRGTWNTRRRGWQAAERIVASCCELAGLPRPIDVEVSTQPFLTGTRLIREFPSFKQVDPRSGIAVSRCLLHVRLHFESSLTGPLAIGSGKYFGLGLLRPMFDRDAPN